MSYLPTIDLATLLDSIDYLKSRSMSHRAINA